MGFRPGAKPTNQSTNQSTNQPPMPLPPRRCSRPRPSTCSTSTLRQPGAHRGGVGGPGHATLHPAPAAASGPSCLTSWTPPFSIHSLPMLPGTAFGSGPGCGVCGRRGTLQPLRFPGLRRLPGPPHADPRRRGPLPLLHAPRWRGLPPGGCNSWGDGWMGSSSSSSRLESSPPPCPRQHPRTRLLHCHLRPLLSAGRRTRVLLPRRPPVLHPLARPAVLHVLGPPDGGGGGVRADPDPGGADAGPGSGGRAQGAAVTDLEIAPLLRTSVAGSEVPDVAHASKRNDRSGSGSGPEPAPASLKSSGYIQADSFPVINNTAAPDTYPTTAPHVVPGTLLFQPPSATSAPTTTRQLQAAALSAVVPAPPVGGRDPSDCSGRAASVAVAAVRLLWQ